LFVTDFFTDSAMRNDMVRTPRAVQLKTTQNPTVKSMVKPSIITARWFAKFFAVVSMCMIIFVHNLLPGEMLPPLVVAIALSLLLATGRVKLGYLQLVWPLVVVFLLGVVGIKDYETRDILRDIAYALTPIALLYIGYWMAGKEEMWPLLLKVMLTCGFVLAINHIAKFIQDPTLLNADLGAVRKEAGVGSGLVLLSLVLGVFQYRLGVGNLFPRFLLRVVALPVLFASFMLSYSRTGFVQALILSLALGGVLSGLRLRSILVLCLLVSGFVIMIAMTPEGDQTTFTGKLSRSVTEIAVDDYTTAKDINANWRGFETYRVIDSFLSGNLLQMSIGQGAGALVDLGITMKLGEGEYRYIPIFHNGYAYVLIKTGLLGIACYLYFFMRTISSAMRSSISSNREQLFFPRLLLGCVLCIAASMYVVGGMAEIHDAELVLLLGYLSRRTVRKDCASAAPGALVQKKMAVVSPGMSGGCAG
jgi:hypothetical protein